MKRKVLDMVVSSWNVSNEASEDGGGGGSEMRVCRVAVSVCLVLRRCRSLLTVCDDAGCWSKPGREGVSALFCHGDSAAARRSFVAWTTSF